MLDYSFNEFVIFNSLYFVFHYLFRGRFFFLKDFFFFFEKQDRSFIKKNRLRKVSLKQSKKCLAEHPPFKLTKEKKIQLS